MSYTHALRLVHADRLYCAVQKQAQRAEDERSWTIAARLHLWLAGRAQRILRQARGQK